MAEDYMKAFDHGTGKMLIESPKGYTTFMARPTELHYKADGDIEDNPPFAIVMEAPGGPMNTTLRIIGEFSLNTIQKALAELGYTLYQP